jgi:hypothetical protein
VLRLNSFYKYCPINDHENLCKEYSLINLFSDQATFSRRNNFNDLFDSKVKFIIPEKGAISRIYKELSGNKKFEFKRFYMGKNGQKNINNLVLKMNKMLDDYLFYCLTDNPNNNLMWSHYANSHNGFCIEWDGNYIKPAKVHYQNSIPRFELIKLIKHNYGIQNNEPIIQDPWLTLTTKLSEWSYEQEYRLQLSNSMKNIITKDFGEMALVKTKPEWIKSIVFGYRMPKNTRQYIINNLPNVSIFKEIQIGSDSSSLVVVTLA